VDFDPRLEAVQRASQANRPALAEELVAETITSVEAIQVFHAENFISAVDSLRQALLTHAADLRARFQPILGTPAPSEPPPSVTAADPLAEQSPTRPARFRIFSETWTDASFSDRRRMQVLEQVGELLNELREQSKREESLSQIRRAQIFLTRAEGLLDMSQLVESPNLPAIRTPQTPEERQELVLVSAAERKAEELQEALDAVTNALYSRWRVEDQLDQLAALAARESQNQQRLAAESRSVLISEARSAGLFLLGALVLAFAILVISDFLRAFLNLSNNSDLLVALSPPAPPPAPAPSITPGPGPSPTSPTPPPMA
jgi:hypothetical protein